MLKQVGLVNIPFTLFACLFVSFLAMTSLYQLILSVEGYRCTLSHSVTLNTR